MEDAERERGIAPFQSAAAFNEIVLKEAIADAASSGLKSRRDAFVTLCPIRSISGRSGCLQEKGKGRPQLRFSTLMAMLKGSDPSE